MHGQGQERPENAGWQRLPSKGGGTGKNKQGKQGKGGDEAGPPALARAFVQASYEEESQESTLPDKGKNEGKGKRKDKNMLADKHTGNDYDTCEEICSLDSEEVFDSASMFVLPSPSSSSSSKRP